MRILLLLDFDGTLSPTVPQPDSAVLPAAARRALVALLRRPDVAVAIVSGRTTADLRKRIKLPLIYAGNHGLQVEGCGLSMMAPRASDAVPRLRAIAEEARAALAGIRGALVEDNGLTLSIHYRQVLASQAGAVTRAVRRICKPHLAHVEVRQAKKHLEIRPITKWNKGTAAKWIQRQLGRPPVTIVAGDDQSDEDMFVALPRAITVKIGPGRTAARYRLDDPAAVTELLKEVLRQT